MENGQSAMVSSSCVVAVLPVSLWQLVISIVHLDVALGRHLCIMHLVRLQSRLDCSCIMAVIAPVTPPLELGK